jgi:hypothetical protein
LWDQSKSAVAELAEVASRSWRDVVADDVLARQEFAKAGDLTREGLREFADSGASRSATGGVLGGAALGLGTAASFVFPSGRGARVVGAGRGAAARAARGLGDEALEGLVPGPTGFDAAEEASRRALERVAAGDVPSPTTGRVGEVYPSRGGDTFGLREQVSADDFTDALDFVRPMRVTREGQPFRSVEETVYRYTPDQYAQMDLYVSDDGLSGFAVKQDGDLVSVFSAPGLGRGEALVDAAIARGARKLDAFDEGGFLPRLYGSKGFVEVGRDPWNPAYKPKVWRGGTPDVVYMQLPGNSALPPGRVSGASRARVLEGQPLEGDRVMDAIFTPVQAPTQFGATTREAAQEIFEAMKARGPLRVVSGEDLGTPEMLSLLENMQRQVRSGDIKFNVEDFLPFTQRQGFADDLGLITPSLIQGKTGMTFRPMMNAIAEGNFGPVLNDLAAQVNNVFTLIDDDVFNIAFYPFMHNATMAGARNSGTDPVVLSALSAVLSAGSAPVPEARAVGEILKWAKTVPVKNGELILPSTLAKAGATPSKAYVELINNPDWLSNRVLGLATKTYVYGMLKMNPRIARALVIDRVDASARLAAREITEKGSWAWAPETTKALQGVELGLGGFAERVVASSLGLPPSAVQENVWAIWRVLRDLQVGNGPSRQSSTQSLGGETMEQLLSRGAMPKAHREVLERNLGRLRDEVVSGGPASRYWEVATPPALGRETLVPKTNMPIDGYLPPAIRTPENVAALEGAVNNAEAIGRGLRERLPWAPIALQLSLLGIFGTALVRESEGNVDA